MTVLTALFLALLWWPDLSARAGTAPGAPAEPATQAGYWTLRHYLETPSAGADTFRAAWHLLEASPDRIHVLKILAPKVAAKTALLSETAKAASRPEELQETARQIAGLRELYEGVETPELHGILAQADADARARLEEAFIARLQATAEALAGRRVKEEPSFVDRGIDLDIPMLDSPFADQRLAALKSLEVKAKNGGDPARRRTLAAIMDAAARGRTEEFAFIAAKTANEIAAQPATSPAARGEAIALLKREAGLTRRSESREKIEGWVDTLSEGNLGLGVPEPSAATVETTAVQRRLGWPGRFWAMGAAFENTIPLFLSAGLAFSGALFLSLHYFRDGFFFGFPFVVAVPAILAAGMGVWLGRPWRGLGHSLAIYSIVPALHMAVTNGPLPWGAIATGTGIMTAVDLIWASYVMDFWGSNDPPISIIAPLVSVCANLLIACLLTLGTRTL